MRRQRESKRDALELRPVKIELGILCSDDGSARLTSGSYSFSLSLFLFNDSQRKEIQTLFFSFAFERTPHFFN